MADTDPFRMAASSRLKRMLRLPEDYMFRSSEEVLADAYHLQEGRKVLADAYHLQEGRIAYDAGPAADADAVPGRGAAG